MLAKPTALASVWPNAYNVAVHASGTAPRPRFFAPLPERGIWTAIGLSRNQFLVILASSIVLFLVIDGPLWRHLHDSHFTRIMWSYAAILPLTAAALWRNGNLRPAPTLGASAVLAFVKWILTAALTLALGMAL